MFHKKRRIACILYLVLLIAVIVLAFIVSHFDLQPHHTWTERVAACFVCAPGDGRLSSLPCRNAYIGHGCRFEATYVPLLPFFSDPRVTSYLSRWLLFLSRLAKQAEFPNATT